MTDVVSPSLHRTYSPELAFPDAARWPDLAKTPEVPARARIVRTFLRAQADRVGVRVRLPSGATWGRTGPLLHLHRPDEFFARVGRDGLIGFGESYMLGAWDADDLVGVLQRFAERVQRLVPAPLHRLRRLYVKRPPAHEANTIEGARANIRRHYDLSNDLFALFLDETMTYSSALFEPGDSLAGAQRRKIDAVLDAACVGDGTRVLEIGSGWGALAIRAARRGATVTTLTLSSEQKALAEQRIAAAGVADRVQVLLQDYRQATGSFDAAVSVEMIEAVGEEFWPAYFQAIEDRLAPGGRAVVQAITCSHERMLATRDTYTWVQKYIFPGGLLPSVEAINAVLATHHDGLRVVQRREFGLHYARTLHQWRGRFVERLDDVLRLGFDRTFVRMWELYLAYSEAGFRARYITVSQLTLARTVG